MYTLGKDNRLVSIWRVDFPSGASKKSDLLPGAFNGPDIVFWKNHKTSQHKIQRKKHSSSTSLQPDLIPPGASFEPDLIPAGVSLEPDLIPAGASLEPDLIPSGASLEPDLIPPGA